MGKIEKMSTGKVKVVNTVLIFELSLFETYPLGKELWKPGEIVVDGSMRDTMFINAIEKYSLYYLLVTPDIKMKGGRKVSYTSAFPFLKSKVSEIDKLMRASDLFVSPEADLCAFYNIDKVYGYDLVEQKIVTNKTKTQRAN